MTTSAHPVTVKHDIQRQISTLSYTWEQMYNDAFSDDPSSVLWLMSYRLKMAAHLDVDPSTIKIDWRHAYLFRQKTEQNWRNGCGVERTYFLPTPESNVNDWHFIGFTPHHLIVKRNMDATIYCKSLYDSTEAHEPDFIQHHNSAFKKDYLDLLHASCFYNSRISSQIKLHHLFDGYSTISVSSDRLLCEAHTVMKHGRWGLAHWYIPSQQNTQLIRWMLVDMEREFALCQLDILNDLYHRDIHIDAASLRYHVPLKQDPYKELRDHVCAVDADANSITFFAATIRGHALHWRLFKASPNASATTAHTCYEMLDDMSVNKANVDILGSGCVLFKSSALYSVTDTQLPSHLLVSRLDNQYVCIELTWSQYGENYIYVFDTYRVNSSNTVVDVVTDVDKVLELSHGWMMRIALRLTIKLHHHKLVAIVEEHSPWIGHSTFVLRRFNDGAMIKRYIVQDFSAATPILGDFFLLMPTFNQTTNYYLFDAFNGTILRKIPYTFCSTSLHELKISPTCSISGWSKDATAHGLRVQWIDYLPEITQESLL
jgi:hypothetical protein